MWLSWDFLNLKCRMNCMKTLNDTPRIEVWKRCILHEIHTNMIKIENRQEIVLVTVCLLFECIDGKLWCNAPSFNRKVLFKESTKYVFDIKLAWMFFGFFLYTSLSKMQILKIFFFLQYNSFLLRKHVCNFLFIWEISYLYSIKFSLSKRFVKWFLKWKGQRQRISLSLSLS